MKASQEPEERLTVQEKNGRPYIVVRWKDNGKWKTKRLPANDIERTVLDKLIRVREQLQQETIMVTCSHPECRNTIPMHPRQRADMISGMVKRYDQRVFVFCSTACRDDFYRRYGKELEEMMQHGN